MNNKKSFWQLINSYKIKIPPIQRDYVQADKNHIEVGKNFVRSIYNALINKKEISLDFIYGRDDGDYFIPIDGQQRLTTLWLLHWYIAVKENKVDETVRETLQKFSYGVRPASQDFCMFLSKEEFVLSNKGEPVSRQIRNQNWYRLVWEGDLTVVNMLNMLDVIDEEFRNSDVVWEVLTSENCPITFYFLQMDAFNLTDDLYIKMNARGKPITKYEYFKAKFTELIDEEYKKKIDTDWLNKTFWNRFYSVNNSPDEIEKRMYNFFENIFSIFYLKDKEKEEKVEFDLLEAINNIDLKHNLFAKNNIHMVSKCLDYFEKKRSDLEEKYFEDFLKDSKTITYTDRVRFYSLLLYINSEYNEDLEIKERWLRITKNLINNTRIEEQKEFINAIKSIDNLSEHMYNIYEVMAYKQIDIEFFYREQVEEEKLKAKLILQSSDWKEAILEAENFEYFDGQIGFILEMARDEENYDLGKFRSYYNRLRTLFEKFKNNNEFLLERALLTKCNYFVEKGKKYTFCNYEHNLKYKIEGWRKVFKEKRNCLKTLLDTLGDSYNNDVEERLRKIIQDYINKKEIEDFRYFFITEPETFAYCKSKILYIDNIGNKFPRIYLISKEQLNSRYVELYTYYIYLLMRKQKENNSIDIEYKDSISSEDGQPKLLVNRLYVWFDPAIEKLVVENQSGFKKEFEVYHYEDLINFLLEGEDDKD